MIIDGLGLLRVEGEVDGDEPKQFILRYLRPSLSSLRKAEVDMRIAQAAPLFESVPPQLYGGTERVVSYLTEELVRQGHEVTLFASGDSVTAAKLVPCSPRSLRLDPESIDATAHHVVMLEKIARMRDQFDVIHFHIDYLHFPISRRSNVPHVTTLHGRLDIRDLVPLYEEFPDMPVVSISDAQREPLPWLNWVGTVYHGLPESLYSYRSHPGKYLAFLGRISPEKRADRAIRIAKAVNMELRIAAKVEEIDRMYFEEEVEPHLDDPLIQFVGEISDREKDAFLGNAYALLFPIDWPEPFGLVMIEAMACGTPVIAYRQGSVPEVMVDGETGFIVEERDDAIEAVQRVSGLSRERCRRAFEERFTAERMAHDYVSVYERVVAGVAAGPRA